MRGNISLAVEKVEVAGVPLWCDTSTSQLRPLVPVVHCKTVFEAVHGLAHPGIRATRRMVTRRFVRPGFFADVAEWCRDCKVTTQEMIAVEKIQLPATNFAHVHVDLVGPLPVSAGGHTHLLTVVDRLAGGQKQSPCVAPLRKPAQMLSLSCGWRGTGFLTPSPLTGECNSRQLFGSACAASWASSTS